MPDTKYILVEVPNNVALSDFHEIIFIGVGAEACLPIDRAKEAVHIKDANNLEWYLVKKEKED